MAAQAAGVAAAPLHAPDHAIEETRKAPSVESFASHYTEAPESSEKYAERVDTEAPIMDSPPYSKDEESSNGGGSGGRAGTALLFGSDGGLVLMPAPTADPNDPLNWSRGRKILALVCLCLFGASALAVSSSLHRAAFARQTPAPIPAARTLLAQYAVLNVLFLPICGVSTALACLAGQVGVI